MHRRQVQVRGEFMRILGRKSDMINVGGQKVFPLEIENVLLEAGEHRAKPAVFAQSHPIMGQVVYAKVSLIQPEDPAILIERLRKHCFQRLAKMAKCHCAFALLQQMILHSDRFKKSAETMVFDWRHNRFAPLAITDAAANISAAKPAGKISFSAERKRWKRRTVDRNRSSVPRSEFYHMEFRDEPVGMIALQEMNHLHKNAVLGRLLIGEPEKV
ncbi:MAG: hypothetical protein R3C26_00155 [Calditrichia bacterium]